MRAHVASARDLALEDWSARPPRPRESATRIEAPFDLKEIASSPHSAKQDYSKKYLIATLKVLFIGNTFSLYFRNAIETRAYLRERQLFR